MLLLNHKKIAQAGKSTSASCHPELRATSLRFHLSAKISVACILLQRFQNSREIIILVSTKTDLKIVIGEFKGT